MKRKETIKDLSLLLENTSESLVLSLNAPWGAGKTTFVKLWKTYLKKKKVLIVYILVLGKMIFLKSP
ncbi:P-loop NTPase fold protein [Aliarcobacter butzleri]|uniref:P-loop NTPase fold protein n=1 Tax=Aliarcobacter butzleri TaxID=28197 RepID=UPI003AFA64F7